MNLYVIKEEARDEKDNRTASVKPRADICDALLEQASAKLYKANFSSKNKSSVISRLYDQFKTYPTWKKILAELDASDMLVVQYPPFNGCFSFGHALENVCNRAKVILFLHDVETIRLSDSSSRSIFERVVESEERRALRAADCVIAHNEKMRDALVSRLGVDPSKIICLELFDYLLPGFKEEENQFSWDKPIVVAGNLSENKAGYLSELPEELSFNLYGVNYNPKQNKENVSYKGSYPSDDLPKAIEGSYGLVWDGPSAATCDGCFGEYLRINNPHKASLYLAIGMPVIVWKESALADLVRNEGIGFAVTSLDELPHVLENVSAEDYRQMRERVRGFSGRLKSGYHTVSALAKAANC